MKTGLRLKVYNVYLKLAKSDSNGLTILMTVRADMACPGSCRSQCGVASKSCVFQAGSRKHVLEQHFLSASVSHVPIVL